MNKSKLNFISTNLNEVLKIIRIIRPMSLLGSAQFAPSRIRFVQRALSLLFFFLPPTNVPDCFSQ